MHIHDILVVHEPPPAFRYPHEEYFEKPAPTG